MIFQQGYQGHSSGKGQSFPHTVLGKLEIHLQENEVGLKSYTRDQKNSHKWIKTEINMRAETWDKSFTTLDLAIIYWILTPKAQTTKENIGKLDFMKTKNSCASKDTNNRMKRQPVDWEKIFENRISFKGFIARIYKELLKINNHKTTQFKNGRKA